jgi:hypothetical protein
MRRALPLFLATIASGCGMGGQLKDMAQPRDLSVAEDFAEPPPDFATPPPDLVVLPDLVVPPDLFQCNNADLTGAPLVTENQVAMNAPTPMGGNIVIGRYFATDATAYTGPNGATGPTGPSVSYVVVFGVGTMRLAAATQGMQFRATGSYSTMGTTLTFTQTCPSAAAPSPTPYTATPTQVQVFSSGGGNTTVVTFTLQ